MNGPQRRILLVGASGQVGWELQRSLAPLGEVFIPGRERLNLAQVDSIRPYLAEIQPTLIVNAAAYTAVDKAEEEPEQALAINGKAPGVLAETARQQGAALIHYSTDYVFDGQGVYPYREGDTPRPLNVYGQTKLAGEQAIAAVGGAYLILRTSWVYGLRGHNFLLTMQRLAQEREVLTVVNDQWGTPTWSRLIAEGTAQIVAQSRGQRQDSIPQAGIYHLSCGGKTTWHGFAQAILARLAQGAGPVARLEAIPSADYPIPARRPAFSCLDNTRIKDTFGIQLPSWRTALELALS
ncbi:dTDP-4-dehydrorhamnose reductase [Nitrosococcus watsonii]|uniref:dTDP-4-dehydrorhamnose reductase n=1 Tax=Nitrosococcus watsoni (strain C-113) TaxID=105559 RepID=D8K8P1_NITWC|nr:dTDP-4-dehydrorhamnose reductase [Nitrosococcus watsonii]ADJ29161.1 dTDP-4-dehydrorhamnose reductase [Nitrosococcus watsonii C-113]